MIFTQKSLLENLSLLTSSHPSANIAMQMTPILMPIAEEKGIHVYQYNMQEFPNESQPYGITSWPTLIHYEDGKEVSRSVGLPTKP